MVPSKYLIAGYSFEQICELSTKIPRDRQECNEMIQAIDRIERAFNAMEDNRVKCCFAESVNFAINARDGFLSKEF